MHGTQTRVGTYTIIDIKKTFEGCEADIRTIARRTDKWTMDYVDKIIHDILLLASDGYLDTVSITLLDKSTNTPVRATKFIVNSDGAAVSSDRPGKNLNWPNIPNTQLTMILSYTEKWKRLSPVEENKINKDFRLSWTPTDIDNNFPNLSSAQSQLYASNKYELQKMDYRS